MIDIIVTTYNRIHLLQQTIGSLLERVRETDFRLFIGDDASDDGTQKWLAELAHERLAGVLLGKKRSGVTYMFNQLWNLVDFHDAFEEQRPWLCYLQDDMLSVEDEWPSKLLKALETIDGQYNIGMLSAYDAPEHPLVDVIDLGNGMEAKTKKSIGASCMMARKEFFAELGKIPKKNPDGSMRGMPGNGRGSHIDLYITGCMSGSRFVPRSAAENCLWNLGQMVLVVPMLEHLGKERKESTWRNGR